MDISALPYFYAVIANCIVLVIFGFIQWLQKPKRIIIWFFIVWICFDLMRCLLIVLSAGANGVIDRNSIIWLIRADVVLEHTILLGVAVLFFVENSTLRKRTNKVSGVESAQVFFGNQPGIAESGLPVDRSQTQ